MALKRYQRKFTVQPTGSPSSNVYDAYAQGFGDLGAFFSRLGSQSKADQKSKDAAQGRDAGKYSIAVQSGIGVSGVPGNPHSEMSFSGENLERDRVVKTRPEPSESIEYQIEYFKSQKVLEVNTITKLMDAKAKSLFADLSNEPDALPRIRREYSAYADNLIRNSSPEIHDSLDFNKKLLAETVSNSVISQNREVQFKEHSETLTRKAEENIKNVIDNHIALSGDPNYADFLEKDYNFKVKEIKDSVYFLGAQEKNRLLSNLSIGKNSGILISKISKLPFVKQLEKIINYKGGKTVEENRLIKIKAKEHFNIAKEKHNATIAVNKIKRDTFLSGIRLWYASNPNASIEEIENQFTSRGLDIYDSQVSKQISGMISKAVGIDNVAIEKEQETRDKITANNLVNQLKNPDMVLSSEEIKDHLDLFKGNSELYNKITNALTTRYLEDAKTVEKQGEENTKAWLTTMFREGKWTYDTFAQWQIGTAEQKAFVQKYRNHIKSLITELGQNRNGSNKLGSNVKGSKNWTAKFLKNLHTESGIPFEITDFSFTPGMPHHPDLMLELAQQLDYNKDSYAFKKMEEFFKDWRSDVQNPETAERIISTWDALTKIMEYNGVFSKIITKNNINEIKIILSKNRIPDSELTDADTGKTSAKYDKKYSQDALSQFTLRPTEEQAAINQNADDFISDNPKLVANAFNNAFVKISDNTSLWDKSMTKHYGRRWDTVSDKMLEGSQIGIFDTDQLNYSAVNRSGKNQLIEYFRAELKNQGQNPNIEKAAEVAINQLAIDGWGPSNFTPFVDPNNPEKGKQITRGPLEEIAAKYQIPTNILAQHLLIFALPEIKKEAERRGLVDVRADNSLYATNPKFNPSYLEKQLNALNPNWGFLFGDGTFQKAIDEGNVLFARDDRFLDRDVFQISLRFADDDEWLHVPLQQVDVNDIASVLFNKYGPGTMTYMLNNVWDATWNTRELNQIKTLVENRLKGQESEGVTGFQVGETQTALKQPNNIPLSNVEVDVSDIKEAPEELTSQAQLKKQDSEGVSSFQVGESQTSFKESNNIPLSSTEIDVSEAPEELTSQVRTSSSQRPPNTAVSPQKEIQNIFDSVVKAEGFREDPYDDEGSKSIGYGFKIRDIEPDERRLIKNINKVTKEEGKNVLALKIKKMVSKFNNDLKDFRDLTSNRKKALVHMAFQLGYDNVTNKPGGKKGKRWSRFWSFVKDGRWNLASSAIVNSKYYADAKLAAKRKVNRKSGLLKRANQNIQWIRKG